MVKVHSRGRSRLLLRRPGVLFPGRCDRSSRYAEPRSMARVLAAYPARHSGLPVHRSIRPRIAIRQSHAHWTAPATIARYAAKFPGPGSCERETEQACRRPRRAAGSTRGPFAYTRSARAVLINAHSAARGPACATRIALRRRAFASGSIVTHRRGRHVPHPQRRAARQIHHARGAPPRRLAIRAGQQIEQALLRAAQLAELINKQDVHARLAPAPRSRAGARASR